MMISRLLLIVYEFHPSANLNHRWQKIYFENGSAAFDNSKDRAVRKWRRRTSWLDGKTGQGPITTADLKKLIQAGRLERTSKISLDKKSWHPASSLKGVDWPD